MFRSRRSHEDVVSASASASIACPPETVMDFLLDPVSAVLTGELTLHCFHVPGTPEREPGARFVSLSESDGLLVADVEELLEIDHPRRAVSTNRSNPGSITVTYTCERRDDGGTDYTQQVSVIPEPGRARLLRDLFEKETLDKEEVAEVFAPLRRRPQRPAWTGSDSRVPSRIPPVEIPQEIRDRANGVPGSEGGVIITPPGGGGDVHGDPGVAPPAETPNPPRHD